MKESDSSVYGLFKYGFFLFGGLLIVIPFLLQFSDNVTVNGVPDRPDIWDTIPVALIGILLILLGTLVFHKFVIVQMNNEVVRIWKGDEKIDVSWLDVESVIQLPLVNPPLYKLRLKNYGSYFLFNTTRRGISFLFFSLDWSDMGTLIRKMKSQLSI